MNNSFGDSFNQRINLLCEKYEKMPDEEDDLLDLNNLQVTMDFGKTKNMKRVEVGSIFTKKYLRKRNAEIEKSNYISFDEIYSSVFGNDFDCIYNLINK